MTMGRTMRQLWRRAGWAWWLLGRPMKQGTAFVDRKMATGQSLLDVVLSLEAQVLTLTGRTPLSMRRTRRIIRIE